jgi:hypothetical protein
MKLTPAAAADISSGGLCGAKWRCTECGNGYVRGIGRCKQGMACLFAVCTKMKCTEAHSAHVHDRVPVSVQSPSNVPVNKWAPARSITGRQFLPGDAVIVRVPRDHVAVSMKGVIVSIDTRPFHAKVALANRTVCNVPYHRLSHADPPVNVDAAAAVSSPIPPSSQAKNDLRLEHCVVCLDAQRDVITKCEHVCLCWGCAAKMNACPLCAVKYASAELRRISQLRISN